MNEYSEYNDEFKQWEKSTVETLALCNVLYKSMSVTIALAETHWNSFESLEIERRSY